MGPKYLMNGPFITKIAYLLRRPPLTNNISATWFSNRTNQKEFHQTGASSGRMACSKSAAKEKPRVQKCCWVIFDLDGTILDSETLNVVAHNWYLAKFKKKYTMDLRRRVMSTGETTGAKLIIKELELKMSPEQYIHGVWQKKRELFRAGVNLMPGVEALICHFSRCKIPMAIASSGGKKSFVMKTKPHMKLFSRICHVVLGDDAAIKNNKPAPDIYLEAARRFSNKPDSMDTVLAIEDSPNGVAAAKAAGMQVVMVPDPELPKEFQKKADKVVKDLVSFKPEDFGLPSLG